MKDTCITEDWLLRAEDICMKCGGHCCDGAHPPISPKCRERLISLGIPRDAFESVGYLRLKVQDDGQCILMKGGKCSIHTIKPETCRAGPFTFDVTGDRINIYLKHERICPIVGLLKAVPEAYRTQYELAARSITQLVAHLPPDELEVICRIDEPDTDKVSEIPRLDA
ncbi:MAG: YkgJ family cysteine cluster protein [Methanoregula sp.]|nr:YkgJ family cysteine cluster protein [Methanoregula sp.]